VFSTDEALSQTSVLVSIGGLPATGKTAVARSLAVQLGAAYVRIDTIETAIARAEGSSRQTNDWELAPGYEVGYDVAVDQLRNGLDVVAESVNPVRASRDAWRDAGLGTGARVVEVEIVCSDVTEHRRRAEERVLDVVGLTKPTWEQITNREYDSWDREHVVVDTAVSGVDDAVRLLHAAARA
jgi:predicted kinase